LDETELDKGAHWSGGSLVSVIGVVLKVRVKAVQMKEMWLVRREDIQ
jgi:hypothetical protein